MSKLKGAGRKGPLPIHQVFVITFIIFLLATFQALWIINNGIKPTLINIAETETKVLATQAINYAISKKDSEDVQMDDLYVIEKNETGNVVSVSYNRQVMQDLLAKTTNRVNNYLRDIQSGQMPDIGLPEDVDIETTNDEKKGIIKEIPLGQATNNALLANLGPKIPVRFTAIGSVQSDLKTEYEPYPINNTILKLFVHIEVEVRIVIPFATKPAKVSTNVPIDVKMINGEVPYFYNNSEGGGASPSIELPVN